jgi:hypothetical protein
LWVRIAVVIGDQMTAKFVQTILLNAKRTVLVPVLPLPWLRTFVPRHGGSSIEFWDIIRIILTTRGTIYV